MHPIQSKGLVMACKALCRTPAIRSTCGRSWRRAWSTRRSNCPIIWQRTRCGTGVPQFQNPLLATASVHSRLDVDRIVCRNLLDLGWPNTVCGDVSFVVLIPVIPGTRLHVNTLYRQLDIPFTHHDTIGCGLAILLRSWHVEQMD
jgi:hypothetical protein